MRRLLAIAVLVASLAAVVASSAPAEQGQVGKIRVLLDGDFSPRALPRDRQIPISVRFDGSISTTDDSHPPALRRLEIALNRGGEFDPTGLPVCASRRLQSTTSAEALHRCRRALVGRGSFRAALASEVETIPVVGRILVFNARRRGHPAMLLHLYGTIPVQGTFVQTLTIRRHSGGPYGTVLSARLPNLAGGLGSITDVHLRIGRNFRHRGKRRSLIAASCPAPEGFSIAPFPFARADFRFADGKRLQVPLTRFCRVR